MRVRLPANGQFLFEISFNRWCLNHVFAIDADHLRGLSSPARPFESAENVNRRGCQFEHRQPHGWQAPRLHSQPIPDTSTGGV